MPDPAPESSDLPAQFRQLLGQCRDLYVTSAEAVVHDHPHQVSDSAERFVTLMDDLHKALLVKVFVAICECDHRWSPGERRLAEILVFHLWSEWLEGDELNAAIEKMSAKSVALKWYALFRPFDQIAPLRNRVAELETIVVRLANLVARADGAIEPVEVARIKSVQDELHVHLRAIPIDEPTEHSAADAAGAEAIEKVLATPAAATPPKPAASLPAARGLASSDKKPPAEILAEALAELDALIGLASIKEEVRTLANFLKVQAKRKDANLPMAELSLHTIFGGNPGTGKTTVARIIGKIFGAMGVLKRGHLVETDRSGLVAEYAGQTGPKTHKKIDEALDGVLFIDEAYTLIAADGDDPYGHEAVQTLLKRMEDNRDRLVVVLAGYPAEMEQLLDSNPGLSSRFSRRLDFPDYSPIELAQIFGQMCHKNQYRLDAAVRAGVILGLDWLHAQRDERFGNGRTVRNLFEDVIRRQANRIAVLAELTVDQLSMLDPADVVIPDCPPDAWAPLTAGALRFRLTCRHCRHGKDAPQQFLGLSVTCPKCRQDFIAEWGEPIRA
jgi:tellurite resistance protein